ncbi:acyl-CoA dehydrogenase family protein [Verticiella alkaliphila]|uniref:acyl-CoA dehydrogenase family protein n=1 Tax=Verticiella alkaliphila TaxID=2779529 RepID=UPI00209A9BD6|nr:acyl-CoA dehydrogenase family protein [Verticiella sp. GG226]
MGLKAYESTSFFLEDCRVPAENLLGGEAHYTQRTGFKGAMQTFNSGRPTIAGMAVGIGRAALDELLVHLRESGLQHDTRIRDRFDTVRRKLQAAYLLALKAAWMADAKQPNLLEASMAKALGPTAALEATQLGMDVIGITGAPEGSLIEKLYRDVKAMDIVEGTGQIQRVVMARQLVRLPN